MEVIELNPADAQARQLADDDIVAVFNDLGTTKLKREGYDRYAPRGCLFTQGYMVVYN